MRRSEKRSELLDPSPQSQLQLANLALLLGETEGSDVLANGVGNVHHRFIHRRPLGMATGKIRATHRHSPFVLQKRDVEFSLHERTLPRASCSVNRPSR